MWGPARSVLQCLSVQRALSIAQDVFIPAALQHASSICTHAALLQQSAQSDRENPRSGHPPHLHLVGHDWHPTPSLQPYNPSQERHHSSGPRYTDDQYDKHHRVNQDIFSRALLVIFHDGTSKTMSRREALKLAAEQNLDLVEFKAAKHGPHGDLPIAKILNYKHLRDARRTAREHTVESMHQAGSTLPSAAQGTSQAAPNQPTDEAHTAHATISPPAASTPSTGPSSSSSTSVSGAKPLPAAQAKKRPPGKEQAEGKAEDKVKVKQVILSASVQANDVKHKLNKVASWLQKGYRVSLSKEVDSTGSADAAERALDEMTRDLAGAGIAKPGKKTVQDNMVTVVLMPGGLSTQAEQEHHKKKQKR